MDLDSRGSRAAASLRDQVEPALDIEAARHAVARGVQRRRTVHSVALSTGLVVAVVAVVGALVGLSLIVGPGRDGEMSIDSGRSEADMAVLDGLPRSPIDGRDSWRLPVVAKPTTGLGHGDTIRVYGRGFEPGEMVGVVMCAREAESEGAGGCMLGDESYAFTYVTSSNAYEDGTVVADVRVRRYIDTPATGPVDCASEAERCLVAIGAAANYDRSGGTYVNFAGAPPFPEPSFVLDPAGPYTPGQVVATRAANLPAGRLYQVQQCAGDACVPLARGYSVPDGTVAFEVTVNSVVYADGETVECAEVCTLQLTGVGPPDATAAPFPAPVPLAFVAGPPVPEDQLPTPSTQPPAGDPEVVPLPEGSDPPASTTVPPDQQGTGSAPATEPTAPTATTGPPASGPADPPPSGPSASQPR